MDLKERFILALLSDREKSKAFKLGEKSLAGESTVFDAVQEAAGESSRACGKNMFNPAAYENPWVPASESAAKSATVLTDYSFGFGKAFVEQLVENTLAMMGLNEEPFARMVDRADIAGMAKYYSLHQEEVDKRYPEAAELMKLLQR